ncbi:hypothetical protein MNBD_UNCLBAC01-912 [hydrothermal vent metagenome]|uniref:Antitoxin n=1 Tax=hydrothermal vent metagenome TaxID=652676 RepID=A0A3B1DYA4_9ZZZZ
MKTMAITQFKMSALRVLDQVAKLHEDIIITKRGKPIAKVVPFFESKENLKPGNLSNTFLFEKDITSPLGEDMWDACK